MDKQQYIAEEVFVVEHSGEIPEVTLHEALYHLTEDPEGPGLALGEGAIRPLKMAVVKRYRTIILRDLDPENRDKSIYRGLARCLANWHRLVKFCSRENMDCEDIRLEAAAGLTKFLQQELADVRSGVRISCINCTGNEIAGLAESLGIGKTGLPEGWQQLCSV